MRGGSTAMNEEWQKHSLDVGFKSYLPRSARFLSDPTRRHCSSKSKHIRWRALIQGWSDSIRQALAATAMGIFEKCLNTHEWIFVWSGLNVVARIHRVTAQTLRYCMRLDERGGNGQVAVEGSQQGRWTCLCYEMCVGLFPNLY